MTSKIEGDAKCPKMKRVLYFIAGEKTWRWGIKRNYSLKNKTQHLSEWPFCTTPQLHTFL